MKKILLLLVLSLFSFSACEKDDICDANTATTPRVVIQFYDITNPTVLKNVTNLKVIGEGMSEGIVFNPTATGEAKYLTNLSEIAISLKTDADLSTYSFILNSGNSNANLISEDKISFFYTRNNVYVSRACGYKTLFAFNPLLPYTQTAVPETNLKWMQYVSVEKNNIDTENETHIKIFF
jgi:hypothetical protein